MSTIIAHMKSSLRYTFTYKNAWLGKQLTIKKVYGNWEESYKKLTVLLNAMQLYVPEFICKIMIQPAYEGNQLDANHVIFKRVFWTFKSCIDGFNFCKSVVQVDRTFLYGKYWGTLLVAVAQMTGTCYQLSSPSYRVKLLRFGFFFLRNLQRYVTPQNGLCLIFYRHELVKSAYSRDGSGWNNNNFVHVYCIWYIAQNFMRWFRNTTLKKDIVNMGDCPHTLS